MKVRQARKVVRNPLAYSPSIAKKAYRQLEQSTQAVGLVTSGHLGYNTDTGFHYFDISYGSYLCDVVDKLHRLTYFYGAIEFTFAGFHYTFYENNTPEEIIQRWHDNLDKEEAEYNASAEKQEWDLEVAQNKRVHEELMANLPDMSNLTATIMWLEKLIPVDDYGSRQDWLNLLEIFRTAGYIKNENASTVEALKFPDTCGRYIIGQAMACWDVLMPCHSIIGRLINEYYYKLTQGENNENQMVKRHANS